MGNIVMFAVVEIKGQQYKVAVGDTVTVQRFTEDAGAGVSLNRVLLLENNGAVTIGTPTVEGVVIQATVVEHGRNPKIVAMKYKRRKGYRRKWGHRQHFSVLQIDGIQKTEAPKTEPAPAATSEES